MKISIQKSSDAHTSQLGLFLDPDEVLNRAALDWRDLVTKDHGVKSNVRLEGNRLVVEIGVEGKMYVVRPRDTLNGGLYIQGNAPAIGLVNERRHLTEVQIEDVESRSPHHVRFSARVPEGWISPNNQPAVVALRSKVQALEDVVAQFNAAVRDLSSEGFTVGVSYSPSLGSLSVELSRSERFRIGGAKP